MKCDLEAAHSCAVYNTLPSGITGMFDMKENATTLYVGTSGGALYRCAHRGRATRRHTVRRKPAWVVHLMTSK